MHVIIIGAGLAGLSAALCLADKKIGSCLVSVQASERAQSVLAEGGINAAMDVSGEGDTPREHYADTMRGGVFLADPAAVRDLTQNAPGILRELLDLGVPFNMEGDRLVQRRFGGQKKTRTAYARSSTGKALMTAMIDAVRRYENQPAQEPLIRRFAHHRFLGLRLEEGVCTGARIQDTWTGGMQELSGPVILAFGGANGMFGDRTTGTTANDGCALAAVFAQGVELANLEMIQYHPTTVQIPGKRMLVTEAARGEGGRLYALRGEKKWYFMEEKYPELGNLMPRDVVSREIYTVLQDPSCGGQVYLDMTGLSSGIWQKRLPDLRREILHYLSIDPAREPVPVSPGIHFFMGGIWTDRAHRTNIPGLFAAGECACQYHGANRLGGNSLLGALYGGRVAAQSAAAWCRDPAASRAGARRSFDVSKSQTLEGQNQALSSPVSLPAGGEGRAETRTGTGSVPCPAETERLAQILAEGLGILRDQASIDAALEKAGELEAQQRRTGTASAADLSRTKLGEAMLLCARARRESRGAHARLDYPDRDDAAFQKTTVAACGADGSIRISFREIPSADEP